MNIKTFLGILVLVFLKTAQAQYWPSSAECEPGDVDCLHKVNHTDASQNQYFSGNSSGDGLFYEVRCVGGNWVGPVCFKTGILMTRDRQGYHYHSGRDSDGSYYCHACGGR
jgi:hypothetical protein